MIKKSSSVITLSMLALPGYALNQERENKMWRTWGMGKMLYSGKCRQTFWGISSNIPGNVAKHFVECHQLFQRMSPNISGNVLEHSG